MKQAGLLEKKSDMENASMITWNYPKMSGSAPDMNYYERIQKSIDYIESNLEDRIDCFRQ
jgi:hypothetical protein